MPIVASGGYYLQRSYPADLAAKGADQLAGELAAEAIASRFGAFGEIGQQSGVMTDDEKKVFTAVAGAHAQGRVVSCLEGGYNLDALAQGVQAHLEVLLDA